MRIEMALMKVALERGMNKMGIFFSHKGGRASKDGYVQLLRQEHYIE